jgi:hypothetical protein
MKAAPSGEELEMALLQLLRKNEYIGPEQVSVFVTGPTATPVYILTLAADVAKAVTDILDPVLGGRTQPSATEWVLFRPDAEAILKAATRART